MRELVWYGASVEPNELVLPHYQLDEDYVPVKVWIKREVVAPSSTIITTPFDVTDDGASIFTKLPGIGSAALEVTDEQIADKIGVIDKRSIVRLIGKASFKGFTVVLTLEEV